MLKNVKRNKNNKNKRIFNNLIIISTNNCFKIIIKIIFIIPLLFSQILNFKINKLMNLMKIVELSCIHLSLFKNNLLIGHKNLILQSNQKNLKIKKTLIKITEIMNCQNDNKLINICIKDLNLDLNL